MQTSWSYKLRMSLSLCSVLVGAFAAAVAACAPVTFYLTYAILRPELPVRPFLSISFGIYAVVAAFVLVVGWKFGSGGIDFVDILSGEVTPEEMPDLYRTLTRYASQVGVPTPTVAFVRTDEPIALTTGGLRSSKITLSTGLRDRLTDGELHAVLAHEVAHVANRDAALLTLALSPYRYVTGKESSHREIRPFDERVSDEMVAAPGYEAVLTSLLVGHLSRAREFAADRGAVAITGDAASLVSALETLHGIERPETDLRARTEVAALSFVESCEENVTRYYAGRRGGRFDGLYRRLERWTRTHPPVEERRRRLLAMDPDAVRVNEKPSA